MAVRLGGGGIIGLFATEYTQINTSAPLRRPARRFQTEFTDSRLASGARFREKRSCHRLAE